MGARLAEAGEEVVFIARGAHLDAILRDGLVVHSDFGDVTIRPAQATDEPATLSPVDVILVCVKSWQVEDAARRMLPIIGPETIVVPLQNGVDAPDQLTSVLGAQPVLGGTCYIFSSIAGPGKICQHPSVGTPRLCFGELNGCLTERVQRFQKALSRCKGLDGVLSTDIRNEMWRKLTTVWGPSAMGALTRVPVKHWVSVPETRQLWTDACQELAAVARAHSAMVDVNFDELSQRFHLMDATSSMQRDVMEGKPSELDAQVGSVIRKGKEKGVATPIMEIIHAALLPQELKARAKSV